MRKKLLFAVLLLSGCGLFEKNVTIHDLNIDFPVTDTITVDSLKQTFYPPYNLGYNFIVRDSVIYIHEQNKENFGHCYSLNSGNIISKLPNSGKAYNEMTSVGDMFSYQEDSIQFIDYMGGVIKTFSTKDILSKPTGELKCSITKLNAEVASPRFIKHNGQILGVGFMSDQSYFLCNGDAISYFGKPEINLVEYKDIEKSQKAKKYSMILSSAMIACCNDKAIVASEMGVTLNVLDVNTKNIVYKRYYGKYECEPNGLSSISDFNIRSVKCDDKNIYCVIEAKNSSSCRRTGKSFDSYVLVYDWQLNPVKRYYLEGGKYSYSLSEDCKTLYRFVTSDEKQELYEYKL